MWFPLWIRTDQDACSWVVHVELCPPTDMVHGTGMIGETVTMMLMNMILKILDEEKVTKKSASAQSNAIF